MADFNNLFNSEDLTDQYDPQDVKDLTVLTILGYVFSFLFFLPKVSKQNSPYATFISNQQLTLFVAYVIVFILSRLPIIRHFVWILNVVLGILSIIGIIDCANGRVKKIPVIGQFIIEAFK